MICILVYMYVYKPYFQLVLKFPEHENYFLFELVNFQPVHLPYDFRRGLTRETRILGLYGPMELAR